MISFAKQNNKRNMTTINLIFIKTVEYFVDKNSWIFLGSNQLNISEQCEMFFWIKTISFHLETIAVSLDMLELELERLATNQDEWISIRESLHFHPFPFIFSLWWWSLVKTLYQLCDNFRTIFGVFIQDKFWDTLGNLF